MRDNLLDSFSSQVHFHDSLSPQWNKTKKNMHYSNLILESILFHQAIWVYLHLISKYAHINIELYVWKFIFCYYHFYEKMSFWIILKLMITINSINLLLKNEDAYSHWKNWIQAEISYMWILTYMNQGNLRLLVSVLVLVLWNYFPRANPVTK